LPPDGWKEATNLTFTLNNSSAISGYIDDDYRLYGNFTLAATPDLSLQSTFTRQLAINITMATKDPYAGYSLAIDIVRMINMGIIASIRAALLSRKIDLVKMGEEIASQIQTKNWIERKVRTTGGPLLLTGLFALVATAITQLGLSMATSASAERIRKRHIDAGTKPTLEEETAQVKADLKSWFSAGGVIAAFVASGVLGVAGLSDPGKGFRDKCKFAAPFVFAGADIYAFVTSWVTYHRSTKSDSDSINLLGGIFRGLSGGWVFFDGLLRLHYSRYNENLPGRGLLGPLSISTVAAGVTTSLYALGLFF
jgi:hypothetical protein